MNLTEEDDAAEVIVIVGAEALELLADGHDADGLPGPRGAANRGVEAGGVGGFGGGLLGALEEADTKLVPGLAFGVVHGGKAVQRAGGKRCLDSGDPVKGHLLPEGDVPEFLVDGVGSADGLFVGELRGQRFKDAGGRGGGAVADEDLLEFSHAIPCLA